jgi:hypothetical protein
MPGTGQRWLSAYALNRFGCSWWRISKAYEGYAKRTDERALIATKRRRRHVVEEQSATKFRNEVPEKFRNGNGENGS